MSFNELRLEAVTILHNVAKTIKDYPSRGKYNRVIGGYTQSQKDVMNNAINAVKNINVISDALYGKNVITFKEDDVEVPAFGVADPE
jgi:hypothetical protein